MDRTCWAMPRNRFPQRGNPGRFAPQPGRRRGRRKTIPPWLSPPRIRPATLGGPYVSHNVTLPPDERKGWVPGTYDCSVKKPCRFLKAYRLLIVCGRPHVHGNRGKWSEETDRRSIGAERTGRRPPRCDCRRPQLLSLSGSVPYIILCGLGGPGARSATRRMPSPQRTFHGR